MLTSKERILRVMCGILPDRVPVSAGLSEMVPVRLSGRTYPELFFHDPVATWRLRIAAERHYGTDGYLHFNPPVGEGIIGSAVEVLEDTKEKLVLRETRRLPGGVLTEVRQIAHPDGINLLEPPVKSPEDLRTAEGLFRTPAEYDYAPYLQAYEEIGGDAALAPHLTGPIDMLAALMGGPEKMINGHFDFPEALERFACFYTDWAAEFLSGCVARNLPMDVIQIGAANCSYSVTSPDFVRHYHMPFLERLLAIEREYPDRVLLQQHTCGRSRGALELAAAAGLRAFEPLERPPLGDVDLAEVKRTYGDRISLKGNINSIATMLHGTPEQVAAEARATLEIGKPGGRFFLAVGDQSPWHTPDENIAALVETARRYGGY
ncbi:MAG: uroporphyrinogen decarboxylase family protein [Kiritimatiellae bacterium]|nr:uroporphyrinogen decarboxylase family protein [Kiritimatiellia bacterium]